MTGGRPLSPRSLRHRCPLVHPQGMGLIFLVGKRSAQGAWAGTVHPNSVPLNQTSLPIKHTTQYLFSGQYPPASGIREGLLWARHSGTSLSLSQSPSVLTFWSSAPIWD